jgi:hypothetical protein
MTALRALPPAVRVVAMVAAISAAGVARAAEYRGISIAPGLRIETELLETRSDGFYVRVAQGAFLVPFERVDDMITLGSAEEIAPSGWTVVVVGDGEAAPLAVQLTRLAYDALPSTRVQAPLEVEDDARRLRIDSCGANLTCLSALRVPGEWTWYVVAAIREGTLHLQGLPPFLDAPSTATFTPVGDDTDPLALMSAAGRAIQLDVDEVVPDAVAAAWPDLYRSFDRAQGRPNAVASPWNNKRVAALAFAPVPGLPSLVRRDWGEFAGALASTAALTAGWVASTGANATRPAEHVGLSIAGAYVSSVASSQLFGWLGLRRAQERAETAAHPVQRPFDAWPEIAPAAPVPTAP